MRIRNNPKALDIIGQYTDIVIFQPKEYKGNWREYFSKKKNGGPDSPLHVELGMGRGKFISTHGVLHRNTNFIGIDLRHEIILSALGKVLDNELDNVVLLPYNILNLEDAFEEGEVNTFYINFCDPWPKVRHAKRRLTHRLFLEKYRTFLKSGGKIEFKTDSRELFDFSVNEFQESGFEIRKLTHDLHSDSYPENITTEYEEKFLRKGVRINRLEAVKK
ncbi:MAG TPA: tRNA (guanosine(46)-N7)-methyltransferase TrmB [Clostridia bacterium]|nr:tRNA (guanosine(46)-N7)-methyltransferase TrmB [Clostridia bacterium]